MNDGHELAFAVSATSHSESIAHRIRDVFEADIQLLWRPAGLPGGGYQERSLLIPPELHDFSTRGGHDVSVIETEAIA